MTKYYVAPKNLNGERMVSKQPYVDMTGVDIVELPYTRTEWYEIKGKNRPYPAHKVALAVLAGQVKVEDLTPMK